MVRTTMSPVATARAVWFASFSITLAAWAEEPPQSKKPADDPPAPTPWKVLFDGKTLKDWKVTEFGGEGAVDVDEGAIVMQRGSELTGIHWTGPALPKMNYEVALEAKKIDGSDFFCGLVFPIGESYCSFVVGGWGGGVIGLSAVDGLYAVDNQTASYDSFDENRWYKIRLRVSEHLVQAWIDNKRVVHLTTKGHKFSVHPAVDLSKPLGVSCYSTVAAVRNIRIRDLSKLEAQEMPQD